MAENSITPTGEITWEEFTRCAEEILKISNEISDEWEIVRTNSTNNEPGSLYLRKKCFIKIMNKNDTPDTSTTTSLDTTTITQSHNQIPLDPSSKQIIDDHETLAFEYHVVYNLAYAVPVLYFNAHKSNGTLLRVEDAWNIFDTSYKTQVDMQSTLTQMEHPILFRPFLTLHPCRTNEFLRIMNQRFVVYISIVLVLLHLFFFHSQQK